MAQKKLQATAKLFLDTSSAQQDAAQFVKDIKQKLQSIETAADKVTVFKDLVGYIGQVDRALSMLKAKNADVFTNMFDGLDANLREQLEGIFGISGSQLGQLDVLRDKLATLTPKSGIKELRNFAKEINGLFASIGQNEPFNIDEQFSGRASQAHIDLLTNELTKFATVWSDVNNQIKSGFNFGGGKNKFGEDAIAQIDKKIEDANKKINAIKAANKELDAMRAAYSDYDDTQILDDSIDATVESARELAEAYQQAAKQRDDFITKNDTSSKEYYQNELQMAKLALKAREFVDYGIDNGDDDLESLLDAEKFGKGTLRDYIDKISATYDSVLDEISEVMNSTIDGLQSEIESLQQQKEMLAQKSKQENTAERAKQAVNDIKALKAEIDKKSADGLLKDEELVVYIQKISELSTAFKSLSQSVGMPEGEIKEIEGMINTISQTLNDRLTGQLKQKDKNPISALYEDAAVRVKKAVGEIAKLDKEYDAMLGSSAKIDAFDKNNPSDLQREYIVEAFREYQKNKSAIQSMSMTDVTNKDIALLEKQLQLLKTINQASIKGASDEDYQKLYGLDGTELKDFSRMFNKQLNSKSMDDLLGKLRQALQERKKKLVAELAKDNEELAKLIEESGEAWDQFLTGKGSSLFEPNNVKGSVTKELEQKAAKNVEEQKRFNALKSQFDESIKGFMDTGLIDITGNEQKAYNDVLDGIRNNTIKTVDECKEKFAELAKLNYEELNKKYGELQSQQTPEQDHDVSDGIAKIGSAADAAKKKVDALKDSIQNAFVHATDMELKAGRGELESKETMSLFSTDGLVSNAVGKYGQVDTDTIVNQLVSNLKNNMVMSLHNHANGNDMFSAQDLESFAKLYYGQGTKINGIIVDGMVKTIDFSGISQELAIKIAQSYADGLQDIAKNNSNILKYNEGKIEFTDQARQLESAMPDIYKDMVLGVQNEINKALNDAFIKNGVEPTIQQFEYTQLPELAKYLVDIQEKAKSAISPVEKLMNLVSAMSPEKAINWSDFSEVLDQFNSGAIDGSKAINKILGLGIIDSNATGTKLKSPESIYNSASDSTKKLLDQYYEAVRKRQELANKNYGIKLDGFNNMDPSELHKNFILEAYKEYKRVIQEIANMPIVETDDDKKKLQDLQEEALHLQATLSQVGGGDRGSVDYAQPFGIPVDEIYDFCRAIEGLDKEFMEIAKSQKQISDEPSRIWKEIPENITSDILANGDQWQKFIDSKLPKNQESKDIRQEIYEKLTATVNDIIRKQQEKNSRLEQRSALRQEFKEPFKELRRNKLLDDSAEDAYDEVMEGISNSTLTTIDQCIAKFEELSGVSLKSLESLSQKVKIIKDVADAYDDLANAQIDGDDYDKEQEKVDAFEDQYYGIIATMQDGSKVNITLDDEFSEATSNMLKDASKIQDIQLVPRSAEGAMKAYEALDRVFANLKQRWRDPDTLERAVNSFDAGSIDTFKRYLQDSVDAIKLGDPDFQFGSQEQFDFAISRLQKLEELSKRINLGNAFTEYIPEDLEWADNIESAYHEVLSGIKNGTYTTVEECIAKFKELGEAVEGYSDTPEHQGSTATGTHTSDSYKTAAVVSDEINDLNALQAKLLEVKAAVDAKTTAFEEEYVTVDGAVEAEIASLQSLIGKLLEVAAQIDSISNGLLKINSTPVSLDITAEGSQLEATKNIDAEVSQLAQLQQTLASVTSAVVAKTKAFSDEGIVVGQAIGKEIAALKQLSGVVDSIGPKVKSLTDGLKQLGKQDKDIIPKEDEAKKDDKKKEKSPEEQFKADKAGQIASLDAYRKSLKDVDYLTDDLRGSLQKLAEDLANISTPLGLEAFKKDLVKIKKQVSAEKSAFDKTNFGYINSEEQKLKTAFNRLTKEQQLEVQVDYEDAIAQLEHYRTTVKDGKKIELDAINEVTAALFRQMDAYDQVNKEAKKNQKQQEKGNDKYGSTTAINATAKFNRLSEWAGKDQFANSEVVTKSLEEYTAAYQKMINKQKELSQVQGTIPEQQKAEFKRLTDEYNAQAKALEKILAASEKLTGSRVNKDPFMLGEDFVDDAKGREAALKSFMQTMDGVDASTVSFTDDFNKCMFSVNNGDGTFTKITAKFTDARNEIVALGGETKKATTFLGGLWDELKGKFKSIGTYLIASVSFYEVWNVIKQGVGYITEIDSALTELKKVTNETDASYGQFLQNMSKTGSTIGATVADLTTMASEWSRLGYSMEEAGRLAESTAILLNVSEFTDATAASEALISTMQAFQYTADESGHVVDILNEVGNNYAISSDGIATALQDSASALMEAGNTLEQSVALVASANKVVQDPNSVGSALRTISLRLRGTSVEVLEEMGEETDGVVESVSKMQEKIQALTGVNILTDTGAYKETYQILYEIGQVWEDMADIDQAALLELMAGKNRANTLAAILGNMEDLEGAYESALNAEGSAMRENEAYLDSIQGRIDLFNNAVQTMWMNLINSDTVKGVVDIGTGLIKFLDSGAGKVTAFGAALAALGKFLNIGPAVTTANNQLQLFGKTFETIKNNFNELSSQSDNWFGKTIGAGFKSVFGKSGTGIDLSGMLSEEDFNTQLNKYIDGFNQLKGTVNEVSLDDFINGVSKSDAAMGAALRTCEMQNGALASSTGAYQAYTGATTAAAVGTSAVGGAAQQTTGKLIGMKVAALAANAALTMGLSLAISLLSQVVMGWINSGKAAKEAAQSAVSASQGLREQNDALADYKDQIRELRTELDSGNLSEQEAYNARQQLVTIQDELISKFGLEAEGINIVTGAIDNQIAAIDKLSQKNAQQWLNENQDSINNAIEFFDSDIRGSGLDSFWEAEQTSITNWGSTKNVTDMVEEYANAREHMSAINNLAAQDVMFFGSVEEVKTEVEDFMDWLGAQEDEMTKKKTDLLSLPDQSNEVKSQIKSLEEDIVQIKDLREKMGKEYQNWFGSDSAYAANKALLEETQINTALTKYADQYGNILQAQQDLAEAQAKGDKDAIKAALGVIDSQAKGAAKQAEQNGQNYMVNFFKGINSEYAQLRGEFTLEDDLLNKTAIQQRVKEIMSAFDGKNAQEILQLSKMVPSDAAIVELQSFADAYDMTVEQILGSLAKLGSVEGGFAVAPKTFTMDDLPDYSSRISSMQENISAYQQALESLESGSFTMSDFVALIEKFPGLAKGVDISSKKFNGLSKNLRKAIRNSPDDLIDDLKDLRSQLKDDASIDLIDSFIESIEGMSTDNIESLSSEYITLADSINSAKQAQNELQAAMSNNPDEGFETRGGALDQMKALMEEGKIGSESELWDIAEAYGFSKESAQSIAEAYGFTYDSAASINENADALATFISIRQRWYKTDENGNYTYEGTENFLNDAEKVIAASKELEGVKWNYNEDTGTLDIDFANQDWDKIVDVLGKSKELAGLTSDEFYDLLMRVGQFHNINWQDSDDLLWYLDKLNKDVESVKEKFENTENAVKSFVTSEGYSTDILELGVDSEEFKNLPDEIQKVLNRYHEVKIEFEKDPLEINFQLSKDAEKNLKDGLTKESIGALSQLTDIIHDADTGVAWVSFADLSKKAEEAGMDIDVLGEKISELSEAGKLIDLHTTKDDPLGLKAMQADAQSTTNYLRALGVQASGLDGAFTIGVPSFIDLMVAAKWTPEDISAYISSLNAQGYTFTYTTEENEVKTLDINTEEGQAKVNELVAESNKLTDTETLTVNLDGTAEGAIATMKSTLDSMTASEHDVTVNIITNGELPDIPSSGTIAGGANRANGTAHARGSWGAPKTETALVGELGPELLVRGNRWTTVGDNGAEFTQVRKGDIIFNHKQTADLLSKGYVTGRGKMHGGAFASGTAYFDANSTCGRYEFNDDSGWKEYDVNDEVVDSLNGAADAAKKISNAIDEAADSVEKFEETLDFIEIRMEEFDERIGKLSAELENLTTYAAKNAHLDKIIAENQKKYSDSLAGAKYYENYAQKYLAGMNGDLVAAAKNGAIAITEFTKEQDEATINAIQNYRDYAQKAADLYQQAEEILTEIRDSVIQKIDNIQSYGDAKTSIEDLQTEKLQNRVDYWETKGEIPASAYYGVNGGDAKTSTGMFENSYKKIEYWTPLLEDMQKEFNDAVKSGKIEVGTIEWYEQLEKLYNVQSEIDAATIEIEEFQNAINDLYWDNFDQLINRLDYLKDETQNLIDLMDSEDMVVDPAKKKYENGTVEFWTADDVKWSKEGLASLGLYAQQMEIAEYKSKQYAEAIDDLAKEYKAGHYSENEYYEKLNELKGAQYESIEAYYDAQEAIKDLNEARIDSIKKGIDKEIEAYEELIEKKKESLDAEKDMYDFQKGVVQQQKEISTIERKLAALAYDNSASARAQRAQLEAELAELKAELDETYYDRSIEEQQNALDKELENFQKAKDAEVTKMEEYLEDIKQVVSDSLITVQANASGIYDTLSGKAQEYNLTLSDSILTPWKDSSLAVSDYQETFDTAMSSTMDQLDALKNKWQEVIDKMAEAGNIDVSNINKENANYATAKKNATSSTGKQTSSQHDTYTVKSGDSLWAIAEKQLGAGSRWQEVYNLNKDIISNPDVIQPGWKLKIPKYAKGTLSAPKDQLSILDELGEELRLIPDGNGRLAYMKKGTGVVPADLTANLMEWGKLDPTTMLEQNRPEIGVSPSVVNNTTEIHIDASVGELLHVEHLDGNNPAEISKIVDKAWDKRMKELNGYVRRYVR
jgi:TP901 family phage tail tape measure protein